MKIIYISPYSGEVELVKETLIGHEIFTCTSIEELSKEVLEKAECLSVFVSYQVTPAVLAELPALRLIATRSVGFDHIDMARADERGIVVTRVPHYGTRTVAEFAFALMFALSRKAYQAYVDMQELSTIGPLDKYEGFDLAGKTLGVVGTGAIGFNVCQIALGIGMKVVACDSRENADLLAKGVTYQKIDELFKTVDIITLHIPSLPETYHLINEELLGSMKPTAYLINTARGEIVDTAALVKALQDKKLAGAALDVLESEHDLRDELTLLSENETKAVAWKNIVADHALIDMPNVIVTPHIAFNTKEAKREITEITCSNITAFAAGAAQNIVTK